MSFFIQYTFGLSRNYSAFFDTFNFFIACSLFTNIHLSDKGDKWKFKLAFCIIGCAIISAAVNIKTSGIGSIMTIGRVVLFYLLIHKTYIDNRIKFLVILLSVIQVILLQVVDVSSYNPNTIGLVYLTIGIFFALCAEPKNLLSKIIYFTILCIVGYLLYLTESRASLMAYIFFCSMLLLPPVIYGRRNNLIAIMIMLTVGSLLYAILYVYLWRESAVDADIISAMVDNTGKQLFSGRQNIWQECIELWKHNVLWGVGSNIQLYSFDVVNLHNSMLNIFVIYGSIVGALMIYYMCGIVNEFRAYAYNKKIHDCLSAYFAFLLVAFNETNLFVFAFISLFPLMMAHTTIVRDSVLPVNS